MVPQGGNTSMVGGATPSEDGRQIVISLARMNRVRDVDPVDFSLTVEAGVTLKAAQDAAEAAGCLLPLSISAEGSAQIGGVLATNAGGNTTVRFGNARDLVLGLEVVLPDGQVWNGLRRLRKDNTGYCLRQLFVGSEGTLGIITAAVLKLAPRPREVEVALCGLPSPEAALALFTRLQRSDPAALVAFEYMSGAGMGFVLRHIPGATLPLRRAGAALRADRAGHAARRRRAARGAGGGADGGDGGRRRAGRGDRRERARSARRSGGCARSMRRRRSARVPASRTTSRCRCRACRS